jgi:hypothetical protein
MCTYSSSGIHVLGENYALRLNDEEVDELLNIVEQTLERGLGDGEVLTRPELGGKATAKCQLSSNLCSSGCTKCQVEELEGVADDVEVSRSEDEEDGSSKGNAGRARILPAQEAVEHAVVIYPWLGDFAAKRFQRLPTSEVLACSCLVIRRLSRVGKISKLVAGLVSLCLDILADGSCKI